MEVETISKELEYIFNTWGTYQSFQKDIEIIKFFLDRQDEKIRQRTVLEYFKGTMVPKTTREHIYKLLDKEILIEDYEFKGTYFIDSGGFNNIGSDLNRIVRLLIGKDFHELLIRYWQTKSKPIEPIVNPHKNELDNELDIYEKELDEYTDGYY